MMVMDQAPAGQGNLFGNVRPTKGELLDAIIQRLAKDETGTLFADADTIPSTATHR